jgi:ketose-bisphosphate aldolase
MFQTDDAYFLSQIILNSARKSKFPICFHLDHGSNEQQVIRGIRYGCTGIMIDASKMNVEENINITKRVVSLCKNVGIPVEGELGCIGSNGKIQVEKFTDALEARYFVEKTGVTALAVMVGTAHGRYKKAPEIDIQRISDIRNETQTALVLHGGSGIPDKQIREAINAGIRKINFATDICYAFIDTIFETSRDKIAIDLFMKEPINSVKKYVSEKILLLKANNRV